MPNLRWLAACLQVGSAPSRSPCPSGRVLRDESLVLKRNPLAKKGADEWGEVQGRVAEAAEDLRSWASRGAAPPSPLGLGAGAGYIPLGDRGFSSLKAEAMHPAWA